MASQNVKNSLFKFQNGILIKFATRNLASNSPIEMLFLGNNYSGYWFPEKLVHSRGTIWGVGLGFDSSFERELEARGFQILGFEPDQKSYSHAIKEFEGTNAKIFPWGLWDKDGTFESFGSSISIVNIFDSRDGNHDSLEIRDIYESASSMGLRTQNKPRVLKLNIEGAEREILLSLISKPLDFDVVIFQAEFLLHLGFLKFSKKLKAALELRRILQGLIFLDYRFIHFKKNQFTLIK